MTATTLTATARKLSEGSTGEYELTLTDVENNQPFLLDDIDDVRLTLYERGTRMIINGRNRQSALNANNVSVVQGSTKTVLTWEQQEDDNVCILAPRIDYGEFEAHVAVFEIQYKTTRHLTHTAEFFIKRVPYTLP